MDSYRSLSTSKGISCEFKAQISPIGLVSSARFMQGVFTQNERQKYVSPVNTHEPNSSAPQNFTDLLLAAPNRYNRKRKKEKQIHVNGYLPPSEESTALSIRKPRRNSENTPYKNTLSEISTLDEKALKNLGWTKVLRSHCGLNQFWYFPPHSSPFISESVENLQCFSSLDGGEMQKHLSSNPVLLQGDFNIVWEAMRKEGWDKVRIEERHDSEDEVKYFYEYFYSPILSQCRDWGIQRFCSQEAVLNYIARFPYPLQTEEEFVKTLKRHNWLVQTASNGELTMIVPDTECIVSSAEARCLLWEQPQSLFGAYWVTSQKESRVSQGVFLSYLSLSHELAKQREYIAVTEEEAKAIYTSGVSVRQKEELEESGEQEESAGGYAMGVEKAPGGEQRCFIRSIDGGLGRFCQRDQRFAAEALAAGGFIHEIDGELCSWTPDDPIFYEDASRYDEDKVGHVGESALVRKEDETENNDGSMAKGVSSDSDEAPLMQLPSNVSMMTLQNKLFELLDDRFPNDWEEDEHGVSVWSLMVRLGWRRHRQNAFSNELIIASWVPRKDGAEELDLWSLLPGLDYFTVSQDEDILFALLTSWFEGKRDVHLVLRMGMEKLDRPHRSFSVYANLCLEREKICGMVIAQVKEMVSVKGATITIDDLLPFMLQLGWEVKYGRTPSRMDELVEFEDNCLVGFPGALLPPWTIFGYHLSEKIFHRPAVRPIDLENLRYNLDYFSWSGDGWNTIIKDVIRDGAETLLFPTNLRVLYEAPETSIQYRSDQIRTTFVASGNINPARSISRTCESNTSTSTSDQEDDDRESDCSSAGKGYVSSDY